MSTTIAHAAPSALPTTALALEASKGDWLSLWLPGQLTRKSRRGQQMLDEFYGLQIISVVFQFLSRQEQLAVNRLSTDFYNRIVPLCLKKMPVQLPIHLFKAFVNEKPSHLDAVNKSYENQPRFDEACMDLELPEFVRKFPTDIRSGEVVWLQEEKKDDIICSGFRSIETEKPHFYQRKSYDDGSFAENMLLAGEMHGLGREFLPDGKVCVGLVTHGK